MVLAHSVRELVLEALPLREGHPKPYRRLGLPEPHLVDLRLVALLVALAWSHLPAAWGHPLPDFSSMQRSLEKDQAAGG